MENQRGKLVKCPGCKYAMVHPNRPACIVCMHQTLGGHKLTHTPCGDCGELVKNDCYHVCKRCIIPTCNVPISRNSTYCSACYIIESINMTINIMEHQSNIHNQSSEVSNDEEIINQGSTGCNDNIPIQQQQQPEESSHEQVRDGSVDGNIPTTTQPQPLQHDEDNSIVHHPQQQQQTSTLNHNTELPEFIEQQPSSLVAYSSSSGTADTSSDSSSDSETDSDSDIELARMTLPLEVVVELDEQQQQQLTHTDQIQPSQPQQQPSQDVVQQQTPETALNSGIQQQREQMIKGSVQPPSQQQQQQQSWVTAKCNSTGKFDTDQLCPYCSKEYSYRQSLLRHLKSKHVSILNHTSSLFYFKFTFLV